MRTQGRDVMPHRTYDGQGDGTDVQSGKHVIPLPVTVRLWDEDQQRSWYRWRGTNAKRAVVLEALPWCTVPLSIIRLSVHAPIHASVTHLSARHPIRLSVYPSARLFCPTPRPLSCSRSATVHGKDGSGAMARHEVARQLDTR